MAVPKMTTQNPTTGRPSCIDGDGKEKGGFALDTNDTTEPGFLFWFEGMDGGGRQHGRCSKHAWCGRNVLRFLGFSLSAA